MTVHLTTIFAASLIGAMIGTRTGARKHGGEPRRIEELFTGCIAVSLALAGLAGAFGAEVTL